MTKEELEKEADKWLCNNLHSASEEDFIKAMIDIAEPREKKIKSLGERCLQLQKDKGELIDKVAELEEQIENMKCCGNCAKNGHICVAEEMQGKLCGKNKNKWELRR